MVLLIFISVLAVMSARHFDAGRPALLVATGFPVEKDHQSVRLTLFSLSKIVLAALLALKRVAQTGWDMAKYTSEQLRSLAQAMDYAKSQNRPFAVLTGAGCSVTAGIPSAKGLIEKIDKSSLGPTVRSKLGCTSLIGQDYGAVMDIPLPSERKEFIEPEVKAAKVNWGHIALAALMHRFDC